MKFIKQMTALLADAAQRVYESVSDYVDDWEQKDTLQQAGDVTCLLSGFIAVVAWHTHSLTAYIISIILAIVGTFLR